MIQKAPPSDAAEPSKDALADAIEAIAARADRGAFAVVFRYFAPRVKGYVLKLGASQAEAEEVTQDAMLSVWRKAAQFDRKQASASTWVFTIARNRRIDIIRRERRPAFDPNDPFFVPEGNDAADAPLNASYRQDRIAEALKALPPEQYALVQEAFFKAKTHAEIAEESKLPLGTVKSRLRLAFGRLRSSLAKASIDGDDL